MLPLSPLEVVDAVDLDYPCGCTDQGLLPGCVHALVEKLVQKKIAESHAVFARILGEYLAAGSAILKVFGGNEDGTESGPNSYAALGAVHYPTPHAE